MNDFYDWDCDYNRHIAEPPALEPLEPREEHTDQWAGMRASQHDLQEIYGNSAVQEYAAMFPYSYRRDSVDINF